jgi:hypothetical protein
MRKIKNNYFEITIFLILVIVGIYVYKDYGISWDEIHSRSHGHYFAKTYLNLLSENLVNNISNTNIEFKNYNTHPPVFYELTARFLDFIFRKNLKIITSDQEVFFLRHILNYFFYLIGCIYFYLLLNQIFKKNFLTKISLLFFIFSPRIWADAFYNSKDIIHMSLTIINIYYCIIFLKKNNFKNIIFLSLLFSLNINTRISAIFILLLFLFFLVINEKKFLNAILLLTITITFTFLGHPIYIVDPFEIKNYITLLFDFKNIGEVLYFGKFIKSNNLPWHYLPAWILITTPLIYSLFHFVGLFIFIFLRNFNKYKINNFNFIFLNSLFYLPIIYGILSKSNHLDGWRYAYFIYPFFFINICYAINYIFFIFNKKFYNYFKIILILILAFNIWTIFKYHPYQMIYFNNLIDKNEIHKKFDIDYWGLANKDSLKFLLNYDKNKINIVSYSNTPLIYSKWILNKEESSRINVVSSIEDADYIFNNFRGVKINDINLNKFILIYTLKKNNITINEIYKRVK